MVIFVAYKTLKNMEESEKIKLSNFIRYIIQEKGLSPLKFRQTQSNCGVSNRQIEILKKEGVIYYNKSKYYTKLVSHENIFSVIESTKYGFTESQALEFLQKKGFYISKSEAHANTDAIQRLRSKYIIVPINDTLVNSLSNRLENMGVFVIYKNDFEKKAISFLKQKKYKLLKQVTEYKEV